ncbi:glycoside hydrolase family 9 protein [Larkinella rosea]|uniref:T9SS C-terminal target domain-containing protein n=1 Tax=Larkinella rosea TaxID=2025312 RepID=A0A3P1BNP1_9BACT|nr:glycoside hydrolase family 9 protein [Larkinella rosea]RRB02104.1 T9SS C-terminal target domain-containing protein [Larkinella rosea]
MKNRFTRLANSAATFYRFFCCCFIFSLLYLSLPVKAQTLSKQIIVDQFGWRANAKKIIVFSDPINGQNGSIGYTPGTQFQVRKKSDNSVVFTGNVVGWNNGNTHGDSGDKIWHGDFSGLTTPGTYYIVDPTRNVKSYDFEIKNDIYAPVLKTSVKTFFYQRSGTAISATHGGNWNHPMAHGQDTNALLYTTSAQTGTARNVTGGWYDAGDYNKYIPFLSGTLWDLLVAYELRPAVFTDNTAIPESGNGIPDVLDELKWELDWMLKMQQSNGGVNNRVAVTSYENGTDNPATDTQPRYYTNVTTWATATFAALTAHAARTYQTANPAYATTLRTASEKAWMYLEANASMSPASGTDGAALAAADAGANTNADKRLRVYAAAELWRTTGTAKYKTYFESNYKNINATSENGFHPFSNGNLDASLCLDLNRAYFVYCQTPNATSSIVTELKSRFQNAMDWNIESNYVSKNDPYLGFMWSGHYTWGSNQLKMKWAQIAILSAELGINPAKTALYKEIAEEYLHYMHGRNPLAWLYLSNMGTKGANLGGDNSVMEIYHSWYRDGSAKYDGAGSQFGPAPGFVAGGANQYYSGTATPPKGEPPMKAYRDWNTVWPDASWEVTEPAIYYQAAYTFVVAYFSENGGTTPPTVAASSNSPVCAGQTLNLLASNIGTGATYSWRGPNGFTSTQQNPTIPNANTTATGSYTLTATPSGGTSQTATTSVTVNAIPTAVAASNSPVAAGQTLNLSATNAGTGATYNWRGPNNFTANTQNPSIVNVTTAATGSYSLTVGLNSCTKTATTSVTVTGSSAITYLIYEDALNSNWADWSWSTTRNFSNTTPVQSGTKSLSVKYDAGWAGLYLHANSPVSLSGLTHLKFWIHGGTNTGQQIRIILNGGGPYYTVTTTANQWKQITIPLSTFNSPTSVSDIYFQEATGSARPVCYVDKIYLASSASAREGIVIENGEKTDVLVFPNPVTTQSDVTLRFLGFGAHETVQTTLTDVQGRLIQEQAFQLNGNEKRFLLPKLSSGPYFIQITGENRQFVKKLLVK